jgi:hypothetical protein
MTGEEAVVLTFILAAFAIFGTTLGWLVIQITASGWPVRLKLEASRLNATIATRAAACQLRRL